jgi:hypothetical protein
LYFQAKDIEHEIRELVMEAEIRRLVEIMIAYGIPVDYDEEDNTDTAPDNREDEIAAVPDDEPKESLSEPLDHEQDIPPKQKGFWD